MYDRGMRGSQGVMCGAGMGLRKQSMYRDLAGEDQTQVNFQLHTICTRQVN